MITIYYYGLEERYQMKAWPREKLNIGENKPQILAALPWEE